MVLVCYIESCTTVVAAVGPRRVSSVVSIDLRLRRIRGCQSQLRIHLTAHHPGRHTAYTRNKEFDGPFVPPAASLGRADGAADRPSTRGAAAAGLAPGAARAPAPHRPRRGDSQRPEKAAEKATSTVRKLLLQELTISQLLLSLGVHMQRSL